MRVYFYVLMGALAVMATHAGTEAANPTIGTEVGQVYPNYILPSLADGKPEPLAVSKFRGKKIILHQFASW